MSDEPEAEFEAGEDIPAASPAVLRDTRWLAGAIWAAILFALLVTSWAALGADIAGAGLGSTIVSYLTIALGGGDADGTPELLVSFALIMTAAIAAILLYCWWRFASATRQLLEGLAESSDDPGAASATSYWLPGANSRSDLFDLLGALGAAWAVIIVRPVALAAMQIYLNT